MLDKIQSWKKNDVVSEFDVWFDLAAINNCENSCLHKETKNMLFPFLFYYYSFPSLKSQQHKLKKKNENSCLHMIQCGPTCVNTNNKKRHILKINSYNKNNMDLYV